MPYSKRSRSSSSSSSSTTTISSSRTTATVVGQHEPLLPGLPDHLSHLCLSSLPPSLIFSICRSWRSLLYSPAFPPFPALYALLSSDQPEPNPDPIQLSSFDPISNKWAPLPPPPLSHLLLLSHPSFIARELPIQSASAAGRLILVAGTTGSLVPAISRPLAFDPVSNRWQAGPTFPSPRRWCAVGSAGDALYIASGVGSEYNSEVARSVERWDPNRVRSGWEPLAPLRDGRFSREPIEMVASGGKLCMVNSRGRWAKEGAIYDIKSDRWVEMPTGLLTGWTGPATVVEDDGPIFVVDETSGVLRRYEWGSDTWTVVMESEGLKGAVAMAGGGGRVCVTCGGGGAVAVVDVAAAGGRMWTVQAPEGRRVVAMHVLPRMSRDES